MRMMGMAMRVVRTDGFLALYNGLSASLCRQVSAAVPRGWHSTAQHGAALPASPAPLGCPECGAGAGRQPAGRGSSFSPADDVLLDPLRHL